MIITRPLSFYSKNLAYGRFVDNILGLTRNIRLFCYVNMYNEIQTELSKLCVGLHNLQRQKTDSIVRLSSFKFGKDLNKHQQ